jgi:hypothetical protein
MLGHKERERSQPSDAERPIEGCPSNKTAFAMVFKLAHAAEKKLIPPARPEPKVILGLKFNDGIEVANSDAHTATA